MEAVSVKKTLRIQKCPDVCGQGLIFTLRLNSSSSCDFSVRSISSEVVVLECD